MVIKSDFNLLQNEVKKLSKLKEGYDKMINKYENEVFPNEIEKYYKYKLSLINVQKLNNKEKEINKEIDLFSIEKSKTFLGSYYDIIYNFFILLRKEQKIIVYLLNNINEEYQEIFIDYISLIFFDNVFYINDTEIKSEKLLSEIITILIEKELDNILLDDTTNNNYSKFLNDTPASKIIKNFIKLEEVQNYLKIIFSEIISDILEMENKNVFIEPNRIRDYLFPIQKITEIIEENDLNDINYKKIRSSVFQKKEKKKSIKEIDKKRKTINYRHVKSNGNFITNNTEPNLSSSDFDKSFKETISKNYATNAFFNANEITNLLYNGLTHSRLIYSLKEQKIFFNNNEENEMDIYRPINLDEFLNLKDKNPEINYDYSKYELSEEELHYRYIQARKYNKYMKQFYYNQYNELLKDKDKSFSNMSFLKSIKNGYQNKEAIIKQYKFNFEKIKYFIDKMIYKILQNNGDKIPFCIKNIVQTINNYFKKKGKKINQIEINGYIFEFFIGKIIIPFLTNEEIITLIMGQKIDKDTKSFLFYFSKIIKKIFRSNFYDSLDKNFTIFNIYLCEILPYINLIISNFLVNNNNIIQKSKIEDESFCKIIKHESLIINETIIRFVFGCLIENNKNMEIKKLFNNEINNCFNLINDNYTYIIQQFEENKENNNNNIFGTSFLILTKEEYLKQNKITKISLSTSNNINDDDYLIKIKYSLLKFFELIPSDYFLHNFQLIKNKKKIKIFEEVKNIYMKKYINNNLIEKEIENVDNIISFIWYLDYFLKYNNKLKEEYIINDFEKLFKEINTELKKEIINYKNDLSEYYFEIIINNNINTKINTMKNLFIFYSQNRILFLIKDCIFNNFKKQIEIFIYEKDKRQYLYFNKLQNNETEMTYIKNEIFNDVYSFIDFFSQHIIKENIITDFEEIENKYKKKLSLIENVNSFFEEFIMSLKEYVINEIYQKKEENGGKISEEEIVGVEKDEIEKIIYIIEELISEEVYERIWKNQKSKEDEELNNLYENKLSKKIPNDIGINPKYINEEIWENVIHLMKTKYNINNFKTPMDKIKSVENIYKILNKSIIVITNKLDDYSVDDIFPIFVFFLIKAKIQFLNTNLNFIKLLIRKKNSVKSSGFALTQLEMAIHYLKNMAQ
mgnify:CR=1 FL=1